MDLVSSLPMNTELPRSYEPASAEARWYAAWQQQGIYRSNPSEKAPYSILMPPPNVTGILHFGHVLNNTLQDLYIRWNRLQGAEACWFPGIDHAGIATQTKVEQELRKNGVSRHDLGRDAFTDRVWEWKEKYGGIILQQLRTLGVSADWERTLFTMDETASQAVQEVFIQLFDEGLVYRGKRIINWSPVAQSALSDEEVIYKEVHEEIFTLRYHLEDGSGTLLVATVRPETIFADVAVAVNPADERYASMIGKNVIVPIGGQAVPVIADDHADPEFGTGVVKVTPAHDPNDYEIGLRHNLPMPACIGPDATLTELAGEFAGLDRFKARRQVVKALEAQELLERSEKYSHNVGFSERGGEPVEPYLSDQWFVKMAPLAGPALTAVQDGSVKLYPEHWVKTYEHWMTNIRDWCISRQLWWGHRIPVYYAENGSFTAARSEEEARTKLGLDANASVRQDPDVLDTWFSSWLWPMTTMGWTGPLSSTPEVRKANADLQFYLPTDLLVTGPDIIFFWVARMIMATLKFDGRVPFKDVYFTSIIRDGRGRKLSKSLGNSPDPVHVINRYGADSVRFTMIYLAPLGTDVRLDIDEETQDIPSMEIGRNFGNKVWNACRFLQMKRQEIGDSSVAGEFARSTADRWIESRYNTAVALATKALADYRLTEYARTLYDFIWRDFCDWYVEIVKVQFNANADPAYRTALLDHAYGMIDGTLRLLHPVMPFLTEELWHGLFNKPETESISVQQAPRADASRIDATVENNFALLQAIVEGLRRQRAEMEIPPGKKLPVHLSAEPTLASFLEEQRDVVTALARVDGLVIGTGLAKPPASVADVVRGVESFLIVEGAVDLDKEKERLEKELKRLQGAIGGIQKKLSNAGFLKGAKPEVVAAEEKKLLDWTDAMEKITRNLETL